MVLREIFGFPGKVIEAATGSRDVVPTMKTRIDDYKNVLRFLEQGSSGTFDHEVKRLRALLKELEDLKKEHVGGKNRFEGVCKACSRADLHPDILRKLRTIDEEVIRQFTAMAAKSAIGGQQPMEGSPFYPITAGDPTSFKPLLADNSELATTPSEGEPARIFRVSTWSSRQRTVNVVVGGGRCRANALQGGIVCLCDRGRRFSAEAQNLRRSHLSASDQ